ncbi:unnamed protein product [Coccothraustes coccothraustes]
MGKGSGASALRLFTEPLPACSAPPSAPKASALLSPTAHLFPALFRQLFLSSLFSLPISKIVEACLCIRACGSIPLPSVERVPAPSHLCLGLTAAKPKDRTAAASTAPHKRNEAK